MSNTDLSLTLVHLLTSDAQHHQSRFSLKFTP